MNLPKRHSRSTVPASKRSSVRWKLAVAMAVLGVACAIVAAWWWTPLHEWVDVDRLVSLAHRLDTSPFAPLAILAAFVIGGLIAFPVNVLTIATILVCGPVFGTLYALIGSLLSAQTLYEVGYWLGNRPLRRLMGERLPRLREQFAQGGLLAVVIVRIVPIAPYSFVNLVAGSARIGRRTYLLGTAIGMLPSIVVTALFVDRALAAIRKPGPFTYALFAVAAVIAVGLIVFLRRRLTRVRDSEEASHGIS